MNEDDPKAGLPGESSARSEAPAPARSKRSRRRGRKEPEEVVIEDMSHDGRGVTHVDGKTVFVPGALTGERVRVQRVSKRRKHDQAVLLEVLEPSPKRIQPKCEYFSMCGGCALQHLSAQEQIALKGQVLLDNLQRIGGVQAEQVLPPLTGDPWGYRRRARLGVRYVYGKGRVLVGFRERLKPIIADMHSCEVLAPPVGHMLDALSDLIGGLSIRERLAQIEVAVGDKVVALVMRVLDPPTEADLAALHAFCEQRDVDIYLQPGGPDSVYPLRSPARALQYSLPEFDVTLDFLPSDFIQVNGELNRAMVSRALTLLEVSDSDTVLDLFCGLGNFTLPLARRAAHVVGVEGEASLIQRARDNAQRNGLNNASFHVADLSQPIEDLPWAASRYDLLLLDPPRTGAREILPSLKRWRPRRICYVSCHPGTLARDAGIIVNEHGYALAQTGVMDMFAHTAHVESIALFELSQ